MRQNTNSSPGLSSFEFKRPLCLFSDGDIPSHLGAGSKAQRKLGVSTPEMLIGLIRLQTLITTGRRLRRERAYQAERCHWWSDRQGDGGGGGGTDCCGESGHWADQSGPLWIWLVWSLFKNAQTHTHTVHADRSYEHTNAWTTFHVTLADVCRRENHVRIMLSNGVQIHTNKYTSSFYVKKIHTFTLSLLDNWRFADMLCVVS